jgi:hypothetical protein
MGVDPLTPQPHHWLGLCLVTESNQRKEWPLIAQVIYNRVDAKRFPDTVEEVILQPMQFSAFNGYTKSPEQRLIWQSRRETYRHRALLQDQILLAYAIDTAARVEEEAHDQGQRISDEITSETYHYWSPVSMVPKGRRPAWAPSASRLYTPEGVDPERFVFAENVP